MGLFSKNYTLETLKYAKERKDSRAIIEHLSSPDINARVGATKALGPGDAAAVEL